MPKGSMPLSLLLASRQLEQLLGNQYHILLQSIQRLEKTHKVPGLQEDKHSAALAGLYGLCHDYPPNDAALLKLLMKVLQDCSPVYRLAREVQPLEALQQAQALVEEAIHTLRKSTWSRQYSACDYLETIAQGYHQVKEDFCAVYDNPHRLHRYQQSVSCALLGVGYYELDIETARRLLCINVYGDEIKTNEMGSHAVYATNGVHYKPNPFRSPNLVEQLSPINPGKEYTASTLMQLIAGHQLAAAPSTLLGIQNLPLHQQDINANGKAVLIDGLVQAGLTIQGICLKNFLECCIVIQTWQALLSQEEMIKLLQDSQSEFSSALAAAHSYFPNQFQQEADLSAQSEALREAFEQLCQDKPKEKQLLDIQLVMEKPKHNRPVKFWTECYEGYVRSGGTLETMKMLIGVLHQYPALMVGQRTSDILNQLKQVKHLFKLFPHTPINKALQTIHEILTDKYLDQEATSALWIGLLLSLPCDAKFDNFMLELCYDDNKQLQTCRLVGIDNDLSLRMPFSLNEEKKYCLEMKNMLIVLPELMNQQLHPNTRKHILSTPADSQWLKWLCVLAKRDEDYLLWTKQGAVTQHALNQIDLPVNLCYETMLFIKNQWQQLQALLQHHENLTHEQCLQHLYPVVYTAYQGLKQRMSDFLPRPKENSILQQEKKLYQFFSMGGSCPLERLIDEQALQNAMINIKAQCAPILPELSISVRARTLCYDTLQNINWHTMSIDMQWPFLEAFTLLPHLTLKDWQGNTQGDMHALVQSWFKEAVYRSNPFIAQTMLELGANVSLCDESKQTMLHYLCRHYLNYANPETVQLMAEVLLSHHSCEPNQYNANGYTPLLQWINATPEPNHLNSGKLKSAEYLLDCLLAYGANLEAKDTAKHETALDKTLKETQEKLYWFIKLVERGAGIHANAENLMAFLQYRKQMVAQNLALQQCITILQQRNLGLRWLLSQSIWEKQPSSIAEIAVIGFYADKVYLPKPIQTTLITTKQKFNTTSETKESYGRRIVQAVCYQSAQWHVKEHPEMPGIEMAVYLFSNQLFGQSTAPHELFAFFDKKRNPYPVLISQTVPGENLHTLLKRNVPKGKEVVSSSSCEKISLDDKLQRLHPQFLSEQIITAMLIHPEDGKPDNYQVMEINLNQPTPCYRIVGIDNDHAFVRAVDNNQKTTTLNVKCVLFCFDLMRQPVLPAVREQVLAISPEIFLRDWLTQLQEDQTHINQLFDQVARKRFFKGSNRSKVRNGFKRERLPVILSIPFRRKTITEMLDRFTRMQIYLRRYPTITHLRLLTKITPSLGIRYIEAFQRYPHPYAVAERFRDIAERNYVEAIEGHYKTITTSLIAAKQMGLSEQELATLHTDDGSHDLSPEMALAELKQAIQERRNRQAYQAQLKKGDFIPLRRLLSEQMKEALINEIAFDEITLADGKTPDIAKQASILDSIMQENLAFQRLNIKNCAALTDVHMSQLLRQSPDLKRLTLSNCPEITYKTITAIEQYNPSLESLTLHQIPKLLAVGIKRRFNNTYGALSLRYLRKVNISDNLQLHQVVLCCSRLTHASLDHNRELVRIVLDTEMLEALNISYCERLNDEDLENIILTYSVLPRLNLQGCQNIQSRIFHHMSAHMPHIFQTRNLKEWQKQEKLLECCLNEAVINFGEEVFDATQMAIIISLLSKNSQLREIDFSKAQINDDIVLNLLNAIQTQPILKVLKIKFNDLPIIHNNILTILDSNNTLTTLIINEIDYIQLRNSLYQRECKLILDSANDSKMFVIAAFLKKSRALKTLNLSGNQLSDLSAALFFESLEYNTSLETLDLQDCDLNDDITFALLKAVRTHPVLKVLKIKLSDLSTVNKHLVELLHSNVTLTTFIVNEVDCMRFRAILNQEQAHINLNTASDTEIFIISTLLQKNTSLKILNLSGDQLNEQMTQLLLNSIETNTHLEILDLRYCYLQDNSTKRLLALLEKNIVLKFINLDCNPCCNDVKQVIFELCLVRCQKNPHNPILGTYLKIMQFFSDETLNLVGKDDYALVEWASIISPLYGNSYLKNIQWLVDKQSYSADTSFSQIPSFRDYAERPFDNSPKTPFCLFSLKGHSSPVCTLIQLNDGRLVSGSDDCSINVWDVNQQQFLFSLKGHSGSVRTLTQLSDERLVSGSDDCSIRVWNVNQQQSLFSLKGHSGSVRTLIQLNDGRLVSGSDDHSIKVWNVNKMLCLFTLNEHSDSVLTLTQLNDGRLASGSQDRFIKIWDVNQQQLLCSFNSNRTSQERESALTLTQLNDGELAGGLTNGTIFFWNVKVSPVTFSYIRAAYHYGQLNVGHHTNGVTTLVQLDDGRLVSGSCDHSINIWDVNKQKLLFTLKEHSGAVLALTQLSNGRLISGSSDHSIKLWDVAATPQSFVSSFDISFRHELASLFTLRGNKLNIFINLIPQSALSESLDFHKASSLLRTLQLFVQGLVYNCYARNKLFYFVKITVKKKQALIISCPHQTLAFHLQAALNAFFYPLASLKPLFELVGCSSNNELSIIDEKTPEACLSVTKRQLSPGQQASQNRYQFLSQPQPPTGSDLSSLSSSTQSYIVGKMWGAP